ncbi:MAG: murein biosynthesis integral membrane protein MurJ, partial [Anaerococcus sp.]|nr:murein biosynthesis integral membrane protein MurJ [Anaerococcus sp.]
AAYIGAGDLKSIYTTAITIPTMLTSVVANGIVSGYIPILNKVEREKGKDEANEFTSNIINILMIYAFIVFVVVFVFAGPISKVLSPNLKGESLRLAINYTRLVIVSIFALLYASIITGFLNTKGNFLDPALIGLILNLIIILSTIFTGIFKNPYILIYGTLFGYIFQYIRFPFVSKKLGFKYKKKLDFSDKYVKLLLTMIVPIILSSAADQISLIIDNSMASGFFGIDSISKIFYAKTMLNFIMSVVTLSVITVTFPDIAKLGQIGDIIGMKNKVGKSIIFSMILVIPATLGMMALSNPIIKLAFERSAFSSSDTKIVSSLLVSYAPYIIFASLIKILSNGFYSVGDSKTPLKIILIQQIINVFMNLVLSKFFGLNGLAYATSVSTLVSSILLLIAFRKKFGRFESNKNIVSIIKISSLSMIMFIVAKLTYNYLNSSKSLILSLLGAVIIAGIVYLVGIIILKIPEFNQFLQTVKNRNKKD